MGNVYLHLGVSALSDFIDYYEVLQVHPRAEAEVIAKAYRALMLKYHPDHAGATERAQMINEAYEVLGDPRKRAAYDATMPTSAATTSGHGGYLDDLEADLASSLEAHAAILDARLRELRERG